MIRLKSIISEDLRKWFGKGGAGSTTGGGWDRYGTDGQKLGKCGDSEEGSAYAACLSKEKAAKLGPDGRAAFVKRKRAAQSKAGDSKKGNEKSKGQKPTFVKTGANEDMTPRESEKIGMPFKNKNNPKLKENLDPKTFKDTGKSSPYGSGYQELEEKINLFLEENEPTNPELWDRAIAAAKRKYDVYPSAYANAFASKWYKEKGGDWKTKKESVNEDLFGSSLKMKPHEALLVKSVVSFMMDKYGFNAKIIVKKKDKVGMIGDISLNSNSVNNNKFYLHFNPNQSYKRIIQSMIHELTHVKQVVKKELLPNKEYSAILWKGKEYISAKDYGKLMKSDIASYIKLPWEVEADINMKNLYSTFINSKHWKDLKGKDATLDYIIDNI